MPSGHFIKNKGKVKYNAENIVALKCHWYDFSFNLKSIGLIIFAAKWAFENQ